MSTTSGTMRNLKVTDKDGNIFNMAPVDSEARQSIDEAKNLQFDEDYFTAEVSQDETTVNVGLNGVPIGVDSDSPLKFVQDDAQGIVIGSDAPFSTAIAPEYSASSTYDVGDVVMRGGLRYVCSTAITQAEDWTLAHWTQKSVEDEIIRIDSLWPQGFLNATKTFTFNLLPKYQTYVGSFTVRLSYNFLTGLYVVTGSMNVTSTFTPSYSASDPTGSAAWPCVAEFDFDEDPINNASGSFLFGDIINPSPYINVYKIAINKTAKKAFLILSANKALLGNNWFDFYNASSF